MAVGCCGHIGERSRRSGIAVASVALDELVACLSILCRPLRSDGETAPEIGFFLSSFHSYFFMSPPCLPPPLRSFAVFPRCSFLHPPFVLSRSQPIRFPFSRAPSIFGALRCPEDICSPMLIRNKARYNRHIAGGYTSHRE